MHADAKAAAKQLSEKVEKRLQEHAKLAQASAALLASADRGV